MGSVYRARQLSMDRDVALKILPPDMTTDADMVHRFRREVQVMASLDHPNIVQAYCAGEDGGVHYLAEPRIRHIDPPSLNTNSVADASRPVACPSAFG